SAPTDLATGRHKPAGIALDGARVYWTEEGAIARVAKGGGAPEVIASGLTAPSDLAIGRGRVYWTSHAPEGAIFACPTDGLCAPQKVSGNALLVETPIREPLGIAVDDANVYWTNNGST